MVGADFSPPHHLDMLSLAQHLQHHAASTPDQAALRTPEACWSYRDLLATALAGAEGRRGLWLDRSRVAAMSGGNVELALAGLAASAAGRPFLPLPPDWRQRHGSDWLSTLPFPPKLIEAPDFFARPNTLRAAAEVGKDDTALLIATSGSEGRPKLVRLSHSNLDAAAAASNMRLPLQRGDIWLDCLPLYHIGGQAILHRAWRAGATVHLHPAFDACAVQQTLDTQAITHLSLVPAMLAQLLALTTAPAPEHLRYALIGGAALSPALFEQARARGWPLCPSYGMSECGSQVATAVRPSHWQAGEVGQPLDGLELQIGPDQRIRLRGPQLMQGYWDTETPMEDGWLLTADLGERLPDGRLRILGRADDMLISGGENVHPLQVEARLAACPGVREVAITALPDVVWGDRLVALVVGDASAAAVHAWSRQHLASPERPRQVQKVTHLPRNALGKLARAQLPALLSSQT